MLDIGCVVYCFYDSKLLPMNRNLVEARSPLRATFVSGEGTRRHHQGFMVQVHAQSERWLSMNWGRDAFHRVRVAHIGCAALDAVERVPTFWFKVPVRAQSGRSSP